MRNNNVSRKDRLRSKRRAPANYLIVCEGKKTEPNYFNGLKKKINEKFGNKVDVLIPNIEVKGTGRNTTDLVKYTQKYVNYSSKVYGQVWVVFDKDDYNDEQFNKAIENCEYMEHLNKDGQASERNPMTKVYKIFDGLKEYL